MDKDMSQYGHYEEGVYSDHYATHVSAMTAENLHGKSEIAAELAYRDARIQQLEARNAELEDKVKRMEIRHSNEILEHAKTRKDLRLAQATIAFTAGEVD